MDGEANGEVKVQYNYKAVEELIRGLGPSCTYEQAMAESRRTDTPGFRQSTFDRLKLKAFPYQNHPQSYQPVPALDTEDKPAHASTIKPPTIVKAVLPTLTPPTDYLERFVKFACAVEIVGGVSKAREMLDQLERVGQVFATEKR